MICCPSTEVTSLTLVTIISVNYYFDQSFIVLASFLSIITLIVTELIDMIWKLGNLYKLVKERKRAENGEDN